MGIPDELKKHIRYGDYVLIAEMYKERHEILGDFKTVSSQYVQMVIDSEREANEGTAAQEILAITIKYLEHRRNFIDELLTAES